MQFGRSPGALDVMLPDDDPRNAAVLAAAPPGPLAAHAGCPTYANREWRGTVYPADADDLLAAYGRAFNGLELNSTHYHIPDPATVRRWRDAVPDDFRFAPKFPRAASHERQVGAATRFADAIRELGPKLGRAFLQLPPSFGPSATPALRALLAEVPPDLPLAVELRHRAWFRGGALGRDAFELLAEHGAAAVVTDAPGRREVAHASLPRPVAFVRFLATMDDAVDHARLDAWCARLAAWRAAGLRELYFWLHAPDNVGAPALVTAFRDRFVRATGQPLRTAVPPPGQMRLL